MANSNTSLRLSLLALLMASLNPLLAVAEEHDEDSALKLTPEQRQMIDLEVTPLLPRNLADTLSAPGEVVSNAYRSSVLAARTDIRVLERFVVLGDHVNAGQPLVRLFSDELANLLSGLRVSARELQLVTRLGDKLAGKQRAVEARAAYLRDMAQVQAFGLSEDEINQQLNSKSSRQLGEFTLRAPHPGVIQQDSFLQGQQLAAGTELYTLVNEELVWVQARLPPDRTAALRTGEEVIVTIAGQQYRGQLTQLAHTIDEVTRTRMARISLDNADHLLHPGQFARVDVPVGDARPVLVVPESAMSRTPDGDWGVFVETAERTFEIKEVEVVRELPGARVIEGIQPATPVVTTGAFFLASEQAKSGFVDSH